mmetsp:Transcript_29442/g.84598  ORF Transcript_29442/g.84598 Transcript_29442/m.84598 type:complete len:377 (-) Transcript_29442:18-1148(-)
MEVVTSGYGQVALHQDELEQPERRPLVPVIAPDDAIVQQRAAAPQVLPELGGRRPVPAGGHAHGHVVGPRLGHLVLPVDGVVVDALPQRRLHCLLDLSAPVHLGRCRHHSRELDRGLARGLQLHEPLLHVLFRGVHHGKDQGHWNHCVEELPLIGLLGPGDHGHMHLGLGGCRYCGRCCRSPSRSSRRRRVRHCSPELGRGHELGLQLLRRLRLALVSNVQTHLGCGRELRSVEDPELLSCLAELPLALAVLLGLLHLVALHHLQGGRLGLRRLSLGVWADVGGGLVLVAVSKQGPHHCGQGPCLRMVRAGGSSQPHQPVAEPQLGSLPALAPLARALARPPTSGLAGRSGSSHCRPGGGPARRPRGPGARAKRPP